MAKEYQLALEKAAHGLYGSEQRGIDIKMCIRDSYKWKQDRITQEILPIPAAGSDHWVDSARYALEGYIKRKTSIFDIDYSNINLR